MNSKVREKINITIDILIILAFIWYMIALQTNLCHCDDDGWSKGWKALKYFTNIGNLLLSFSSLISLLSHFFRKEKGTAFAILRLCGVVCTTITMLISYVTLSSTYGWYFCFAPPAYLFEHTILPLAALLQLFVFDQKVSLCWYHAFYSLVVPVLYASVWIIVLLILNLPKEVETDTSVVPYFFLAIHNQPVYQTILYLLLEITISFFLGFSFLTINNKLLSHERKG